MSWAALRVNVLVVVMVRPQEEARLRMAGLTWASSDESEFVLDSEGFLGSVEVESRRAGQVAEG